MSRTAPTRRRRVARHRSKGAPKVRGARTSTCTGSPKLPEAHLPVRPTSRTQHSIEYSFRGSLCLTSLVSDDRYEQVRDAGPAHIAMRGKFVALHAIEQHHTSAKHLALVNRPEGPRGVRVFRFYHHFQIARLEFFYAAAEYYAATVDEHHVGKNVLDLIDLMRGDHDGAAAIEVVVQQRIVELLAKQDIQPQCR